MASTLSDLLSALLTAPCAHFDAIHPMMRIAMAPITSIPYSVTIATTWSAVSFTDTSMSSPPCLP
jgi:hypothetical protein